MSQLAFGLRQRIGGDGLTVAVSAVPGLDFPAAFYAIVRSGNVAAPVNPRMPAETFAKLLADTDARAVVLDRGMYERVRPVLDERLELVLLLDAPADPGVLTCAELATGGALLVEPRDRDENGPAAIVLGAGRAGHVPAAALTHHELKVQAVRAAERLSDGDVVLNALSAFSPAHLGAGLYAGATQVLTSTPDPAAVAREAERNGARHLLTGDGEVQFGHRLLAAS